MHLEHYGLLQLSGDDAESFLQGYVTCDLDDLEDETLKPGALCDIKGRTLATFYLMRFQGAPCLIVSADLIEPITQHLQKYLMFARSKLVDLSEEYAIVGYFESELSPSAATIAQLPDGRKLGVIKTSGLSDGESAGGLNKWLSAEILGGFVMLNHALSGKFLPQALNLHLQGAVSFTKGCYLGQEIVARLQHRGQSKKSLHVLHWRPDSASYTPVPGDQVEYQGKNIGEVLQVSVADNKKGLLSCVITERASDAPVTVGTTVLGSL